ncbi:MAG: DUF4145 domain-containing protein [Desulfuromonadaceae bacterium]|nr:DUF4145 domain-containing protein [Desulfuromonadaceae bacterium]
MNNCDLSFLKAAFKISELDKRISEIESGEICILETEKVKLLEEREKLADDFIESWIEADRIEIREAEHPFIKNLIQQIREQYTLDGLWNEYYEKILDSHENGGILDRGAFLRNYYELKPPYVKEGTKIPKGLKDICNEARLCYVYGQYSACVALSRTVLEIVLKDKLSIQDADKMCLALLLEEAKTGNSISKKAYHRAIDIKNRANDILHKAKKVEKRHAYSALDHLVDFLEEIYLSN